MEDYGKNPIFRDISGIKCMRKQCVPGVTSSSRTPGYEARVFVALMYVLVYFFIVFLTFNRMVHSWL